MLSPSEYSLNYSWKGYISGTVLVLVIIITTSIVKHLLCAKHGFKCCACVNSYNE